MNEKTKLLSADKKEDIATALLLLKQGFLVAVPTETVYGLAADARNAEAVKKIFMAKNRPPNHPLIVHIASFEKITDWAKDISSLAIILAKKFWPGPLTLLFNKKDSVDDIVTGGLETIALRVPQHPVLLELLNVLDTGLAAPSANPHKRISPTTAEHVIDGLSGKIAAVLDGGPCMIGLESTIVDLTGEIPRILRPGPITKKMLEDALQMSVIDECSHSVKVAGNMLVHYQPYTKTLLMTLDGIKSYILLPENKNKIFGIMHYSDFSSDSEYLRLQKMPVDKGGYARLMYKTLHDLDTINAYQILVETPPDDEQWNDIFDRLSKAATRV